MMSQEDDRQIQNEEFFISKKISEIKAEIRQLENTLGFSTRRRKQSFGKRSSQ